MHFTCIMVYPLPNTQMTLIVINTDGIAVDWVANKLYFTDAGLDIVGVFDPVNFIYTVLIYVGSATDPRAIALDPNER